MGNKGYQEMPVLIGFQACTELKAPIDGHHGDADISGGERTDERATALSPSLIAAA
jgi:hypothetical protein